MFLIDINEEKLNLLHNKRMELNISEDEFNKMINKYLQMQLFLTPVDYRVYINVVINNFIETGSFNL
jgi:hypothetical protein